MAHTFGGQIARQRAVMLFLYAQTARQSCYNKEQQRPMSLASAKNVVLVLCILATISGTSQLSFIVLEIIARCYANEFWMDNIVQCTKNAVSSLKIFSMFSCAIF
ncbi:hypothetical protein CBL_02802 [Carabus blaptoides fortunei]